MNTLLLRRRALAWAFIALLLTPFVAGLVGLGQSSESLENRRFAAWPAVPTSLEQVLNYSGAVTSYLGDHFGLKRALAFIPSLKYRFSEGVLVEGASVVIGKNKLLYTTLDDSLIKHQGRRCLSAAQLQGWVDRVLALQRAAQAEGSTLLVTIAPDKQSIYPDGLPAWMRPVAGGCSVYSEALAAVAAHGVKTVDLRQPMIQVRQRGMQPYLKNDHHWNETGAYYAFLALRQSAGIAAPLPALHPRLQWVEGGDLSDMLNVPTAGEQVWFYDFDGSRTITSTPLENVQSAPGVEPTMYRRQGDGITTVVIGDSFARRALNKFLLMDARQLVWTHSNLSNDEVLVHRFKPKLVVFEEVERSVGVR